MNPSQFQNLFDSVCRCFGHTPEDSSSHHRHYQRSAPAKNRHHDRGNSGNNGSEASGAPSAARAAQVDVSTAMDTSQHSLEEQHDTKRRTDRLGLQEKEWDELFHQKQQRKQGAPNNQQSKQPPGHKHRATTAYQGHDLHTAQALAQAKLAANPPRYNRTTTKRKRPEKVRDEIFRSKEDPPTGISASAAGAAQHSKYAQSQTSFSRLLHPSLAMCFATPIRGTEEEAEDARSVGDTDNHSDTNTLNTCEDTITSTVYYESTKLAHLKETRPPMPLFDQFKVEGQEDIAHIMSQDRHSSVQLIRLMQQQQQQKKKQQQQQQQLHREQGQDPVPDVKAVSDSSGSDGSMNQAAPSRRKVIPSQSHRDDTNGSNEHPSTTQRLS